jgi:hypothetical protein
MTPQTNKFISITLIALTAAGVFVMPGNASAEFQTVKISWVSPSGVTCHKQGTGTINWHAEITNQGPGAMSIETASFHDPNPGCEPTVHTGIYAFSPSGKVNYAEGESGHTFFSYDTGKYDCGRVQVDAAYRNKDGSGDGAVFLGEIIDYGVPCSAQQQQPAPQPAPAPVQQPAPAQVFKGKVGIYCDVTQTGFQWQNPCTVPTADTPYMVGVRVEGDSLDYVLINGINYLCFEGWTPGSCGQPGVDQFFRYGNRTMTRDSGVNMTEAKYVARLFDSGETASLVVYVDNNAPGPMSVSSNIPTSWVITGPKNYSGTGTFATYLADPGAYTITSVPEKVGYNGKQYQLDPIVSQTQAVSASAPVTFTLHYTEIQKVNPPSISGSSNSDCGSLLVTWQDTSNVESGFEVYRSEKENGGDYTKYQKIATVSANATSYADKPPLAKSYYYIVVAFRNSPQELAASPAYASAFNKPCEAVISGNLNIIAVNGQANPDLNKIKDGDALTFQLDLGNDGSIAGYVTRIGQELSATLHDLRNVQVSGNNAKLANPAVTGAEPNLTLQVSGKKEVGAQRWVVTFETTVDLPQGSENIQQINACSTVYYFDYNGNKTSRDCLNQTLAKSVSGGGIQFREVAP